VHREQEEGAVDGLEQIVQRERCANARGIPREDLVDPQALRTQARKTQRGRDQGGGENGSEEGRVARGGRCDPGRP